MRPFVLTALTMLAFAADSVLNRMAIIGQGTDPLDLAVVRLGSGALALWLLTRARGRGLRFAAALLVIGGVGLSLLPARRSSRAG